jgi:hypothetical protein
LTSGVVPPVESINDAIQLLKFVGECHSKEPVIIFDEFDQLIVSLICGVNPRSAIKGFLDTVMGGLIPYGE